MFGLSDHRFHLLDFDVGRPQAAAQIEKPEGDVLNRSVHVIQFMHFGVGGEGPVAGGVGFG